jgi:hypothetical protein
LLAGLSKITKKSIKSAEIQKERAHYLEHELPEIEEILKNQEWIGIRS